MVIVFQLKTVISCSCQNTKDLEHKNSMLIK